MTAPDVAALAAALHERYGPALCISDLGPHDFAGCDAQAQWTGDADRILDAAARPLGAPLHDAAVEVLASTASGDAERLHGAWRAWLDEKERIEAAAVRAALEGLRAEVAALTAVEDEDTDDWRWISQSDTLDAIDARLADLT